MVLNPPLGVCQVRKRFSDRSPVDCDFFSETLRLQRRLVGHDCNHRDEAMYTLCVGDILAEGKPFSRAQHPVNVKRVHHNGSAARISRRFQAAVKRGNEIPHLHCAAAHNVDVSGADFDCGGQHDSHQSVACPAGSRYKCPAGLDLTRASGAYGRATVASAIMHGHSSPASRATRRWCPNNPAQASARFLSEPNENFFGLRGCSVR